MDYGSMWSEKLARTKVPQMVHEGKANSFTKKKRRKLSMTFTSCLPLPPRRLRNVLTARKKQHKQNSSITCWRELIQTPLMLLYLFERQSLLGIWHKNLPDEAECESVKFAPGRD